MNLSNVGLGYRLVRMGHSHDHHDHHDPVLDRCRELMHEDTHAVMRRVEGAVAKVASPVWRILAAFGIRHP